MSKRGPIQTWSARRQMDWDNRRARTISKRTNGRLRNAAIGRAVYQLPILRAEVRMVRRLAELFIIGAIFYGCAAPVAWNKPGATPQDFEGDKAQCIAAAYREFPPFVLSAPQAAPPSTYTTECLGDRGYVQCSTRPSGIVTFNPFAARGDEDFRRARAASAIACMRSRGWVPSRADSSFTDRTVETNRASVPPGMCHAVGDCGPNESCVYHGNSQGRCESP